MVFFVSDRISSSTEDGCEIEEFLENFGFARLSQNNMLLGTYFWLEKGHTFVFVRSTYNA